MKKSTLGFLAAAASVALMLAFLPGRPTLAAGNTTTYNGASFYITSTGTASATLTIPSGATQCEMFVGAGAPTGGGITDQYQTSTGNYVAATGHPQITANGEYISTIPSGDTGFRVFVNNYVGSYASGQLVCGSTMPPSFISIYGGYGTPSPLPQASVATGTTAYVYQTLQSVPVTCTYAPDGCFAVVSEDLTYPNALPTAAGPLYPCITISGTPSPLPSTIFQDVAPAATPSALVACASSLPSPWANAVAGGAPFALATTGGNFSETSLTSQIKWMGVLPAGSVWTFLCQVEGATTTSVTVNGSCSAFFVSI